MANSWKFSPILNFFKRQTCWIKRVKQQSSAILFTGSASTNDSVGITWEADKKGAQKSPLNTGKVNNGQVCFIASYILFSPSSLSPPIFNDHQVLPTLLRHFLNVSTSFHPQDHNPNFGHHHLMAECLPVSTLALLQEVYFLKPILVTSFCYVKASKRFPSL